MWNAAKSCRIFTKQFKKPKARFKPNSRRSLAPHERADNHTNALSVSTFHRDETRLSRNVSLIEAAHERRGDQWSDIKTSDKMRFIRPAKMGIGNENAISGGYEITSSKIKLNQSTASDEADEILFRQSDWLSQREFLKTYLLRSVKIVDGNVEKGWNDKIASRKVALKSLFEERDATLAFRTQRQEKTRLKKFARGGEAEIVNLSRQFPLMVFTVHDGDRIFGGCYSAIKINSYFALAGFKSRARKAFGDQRKASITCWFDSLEPVGEGH